MNESKSDKKKRIHISWVFIIIMNKGEKERTPLYRNEINAQIFTYRFQYTTDPPSRFQWNISIHVFESHFSLFIFKISFISLCSPLLRFDQFLSGPLLPLSALIHLFKAYCLLQMQNVIVFPSLTVLWDRTAGSWIRMAYTRYIFKFRPNIDFDIRYKNNK